ncbi:hypothetical protein QBZ16_004057 [Prototheca wickerhamii]|uniref:4a-hydroxytetrahydrobiopterin dehydratase n=1 Tax=Prototheca wickerhamii TaxID=3111 RepID=A0AAD9IJA8_PROWI|nr:hypothetical protein QBZ16_004057 [Prototheca wickerhamii]
MSIVGQAHRQTSDPAFEPSVTRGTTDKVVTSIEDLGSKRCLACEGGEVDPLTDDQISHLASLVPGWEVGTTEKGEKCITHKWRVRNFLAGLELFKRVATVAEAEGHHPDLHLVSYNQVTAQLTTHAAGGLTENDFIMAAKIDKVDLSDVLSRRRAKTAA